MTCDLWPAFLILPHVHCFFYKNHIYKKVQAEIGAKIKNILRTYPYNLRVPAPRNFEILDLFPRFFLQIWCFA